VGSNGASQAIVDARVLGARILEHGTTSKALDAFDAELRPSVNRAVLANRGGGPDAIMQMVEDRCGGDFARMGEVISREELSAHAARYKTVTGLGIDELNERQPIISDG